MDRNLPRFRCIALLLALSGVAAPPLLAQDSQSSPPVVIDVPPPPAEADAEPPASSSDTQADAEPADEPVAAPTPGARARNSDRPAQTSAVGSASAPASTATAPVSEVPAPQVSVSSAEAARVSTPVATPSYNPPVTPPAVLPDPGEYRMLRALPWIIGGLLLLGALAFFTLLRRRRAEDEGDLIHEHASAMPPIRIAPATSAVPKPEPEVSAKSEPSILVRRVDPRGVAGFGMGLTAAVATTRPKSTADATTAGPASIEMRIKPMRAGIASGDAVVEFELTVANKGQVSAEDVRISTWMFPAGTVIGSEMERSLIRPPAQVLLSEVDPGDPKRVETSVSLPTERLKTDSVLPVVVAEARYRLADGRQEKSMVKFVVGVPVGGELAHFDVNNPTGLHEGVEARPLES